MIDSEQTSRRPLDHFQEHSGEETYMDMEAGAWSAGSGGQKRSQKRLLPGDLHQPAQILGIATDQNDEPSEDSQRRARRLPRLHSRLRHARENELFCVPRGNSPADSLSTETFPPPSGSTSWRHLVAYENV